ncbi:MAG: redoxin domain-containing protein [Betaproteobacteria bacterium]|nr:redoxin domain-containing protein [Betaproteobacteria bacterium]
MNAAPPLLVSQWFNSDTAITLDSLRGKVVLIEAFQMLCPACVMHSMPQAVRLWQHFRASKESSIVVLGMHSVFEHHQVMNPAALAVYLHEFRIPFPVAVDRPGTGTAIPQTMQAYAMQGTPTTLFIDRKGRLAEHHFGVESDEAVFERLGLLLDQSA